MGIRDLEFQRLLLYAKGLGLKVTVFNRKNPNAIAEWTLDGTEIKIYIPSKMSKTELILTLVHELGHHLNFVHDRQRKHSNKLEKAWERENNKKKDTILPEATRKLIYEDEAAGITWWDAIIKEVNIKISPWKIQLQKEYDLWVYEYLWKNGDYPAYRVRRAKFKELKKKWKV